MSKNKDEISTLADQLLKEYENTANSIESDIKQATTVISFGSEPLITDEMVEQLKKEKNSEKKLKLKEQQQSVKVKSKEFSEKPKIVLTEEVESKNENEFITRKKEKIEKHKEEDQFETDLIQIPEKTQKLIKSKNQQVRKESKELKQRKNSIVDILYLAIPVISFIYFTFATLTNNVPHKSIVSTVILLFTLIGFSIVFMKKSNIYLDKFVRYFYLITIFVCSILTAITYII